MRFGMRSARRGRERRTAGSDKRILQQHGQSKRKMGKEGEKEAASAPTGELNRRSPEPLLEASALRVEARGTGSRCACRNLEKTTPEDEGYGKSVETQRRTPVRVASLSRSPRRLLLFA